MATKKQRIDTHQTRGGICKQLRESARYSKTELASMVDVSKNHIGEIESGSCYPSTALWDKILFVFGYEATIRRIPKFYKTEKKKVVRAVSDEAQTTTEPKREKAESGKSED